MSALFSPCHARAGIFGAPVEQATPVRSAITGSGISGGIFAEPEIKQPNSARKNVNNSSVDGGIFGGYSHVEAPVVRAPKGPVAGTGAAGMAQVKGDSVEMTWDETPQAALQPLASARSNPNRSSIQGGIFGAGPAPVKASVARSNPNASSIQGGIFG